MLSLQNIRNFLKLNWSEFRHIFGREQYVCRTGGGGYQWGGGKGVLVGGGGEL